MGMLVPSPPPAHAWGTAWCLAQGSPHSLALLRKQGQTPSPSPLPQGQACSLAIAPIPDSTPSQKPHYHVNHCVRGTGGQGEGSCQMGEAEIRVPRLKFRNLFFFPWLLKEQIKARQSCMKRAGGKYCKNHPNSDLKVFAVRVTSYISPRGSLA